MSHSHSHGGHGGHSHSHSHSHGGAADGLGGHASARSGAPAGLEMTPNMVPMGHGVYLEFAEVPNLPPALDPAQQAGGGAASGGEVAVGVTDFMSLGALGALYDTVCNMIIRPPRVRYAMDVLGPNRFARNGTLFRRDDFTLTNPRGLNLECSWWMPETFPSVSPDLPESRATVAAMSVRELKELLKRHGVGFADLFEKAELVQRVVDKVGTQEDAAAVAAATADLTDSSSSTSSASSGRDDDDDDDAGAPPPASAQAAASSRRRKGARRTKSGKSEQKKRPNTNTKGKKNEKKSRRRGGGEKGSQGDVEGTLPCIIYLHGNSGCRLDGIGAVQALLTEFPCSVVAFDFSGSGMSDGSHVTLGHFERHDLLAVIAHLRKSGKVSRIGLWGRSMGAATSLMVSSVAPEGVVCAVLDSAFASMRVIAEDLVENDGIKLPATPPKWLVGGALRIIRRSILRRALVDIFELEPRECAPRCFIPVLLGHAEGDTFVKPWHSKTLESAIGGDAKLIMFDGDHNSNRPQFFVASLTIFFRNHLWPRGEPPQFVKDAHLDSHTPTGASLFRGPPPAAAHGPLTTEEDLIAMAVAASLEEEQRRDDDGSATGAAVAAAAAAAAASPRDQSGLNGSDGDNDGGEDADLARALAASLSDTGGGATPLEQ